MTPDEEAMHALTIESDDNVGRAVRIHWIDSGMSLHGWRTSDTLPEMTPYIETVGIWMGENPNVVMVGGSRDPSNVDSSKGNWGECQLIWKLAITRMEWLS